MAISLASLLVVDDDDALVRMLTEAAETRGYQVGCATSMAAADAALNRDHFDVALVDLKLGAESGLDVIRHIKEQTPDAEIVVMSASTSLASAIQSYELSAFAFVQKPFNIGQLFGTIERALECRRVN